MKKTLLALTALIMLLSLCLLVSCNNTTPPENKTEENTSASGATENPTEKPTESETLPPEPDGKAHLFEDGEAKFTLVYPKDYISYEYNSARKFETILKMLGLTFNIADDSAEIPTDSLISIGNTKYTENVSNKKLGYEDYIVEVVDGNLCILAGSTACYNDIFNELKAYFNSGEDVVLEEGIIMNGESALQHYDVAERADLFKLDGRCEILKDGISCDWSASGIEFTADCEGDVMITMTADTPAGTTHAGYYQGYLYFTVWIDGVRSEERLALAINKSKGTNTEELLLAQGLEKGVHTFKIAKQSQTMHGYSSINTITINGIIEEKPKDKDLYIEFLGDSITAGHGSLGVNDIYSVNCDATQAYAYMLAEKCGADCSLICASGYTISDDKSTYSYRSIPNLYEYICKFRDNNKYDFKRVPDLVIINLGTNDASLGIDTDYIKEGILKVAGIIREKYGNDVPVVYCYGAMSNQNSKIIRSTVNSLDDPNFYYLDLTSVNRHGGHPWASEHKETCDELYAFLVKKGIVMEKADPVQ